jgi:hypothetical protein
MVVQPQQCNLLRDMAPRYKKRRWRGTLAVRSHLHGAVARWTTARPWHIWLG